MRPKKFLLAVFIVLAATCVCAAKDSSPVFRVSVMQSDEHLFHESIIENLEGALEKALGAKTKVEISTDSPETIKTKLKEPNFERYLWVLFGDWISRFCFPLCVYHRNCELQKHRYAL